MNDTTANGIARRTLVLTIGGLVVALATGIGTWYGVFRSSIDSPGAAIVGTGIAIGEGGRQTVHGDVNISRTGLTAAEVQQMMSDLLNKDSLNAQRAAELEQQVETLSAEIGVRKSVVENFLRLLGEAEIPVDELGAKLEEIARRHLDLLKRWSLLEEDDDPAIRKLTDAAKAAIDAGDYDRADQLLAEAEGQDLAAARQAQELAAQATAAANRRFLSAAAKRSKRGELRLIQFDYEGAARHFQAAADLVPPGEPLVLANYLMRAGSAWRDAARFAQAQPMVERALSIREQNLGSEHPDVAVSLNDLALLHLHQAQLSEAEPLMRRALAIDEASYGAEHPEVAADLNNLAQLLQATNRLSEAEPLSRRHVLIFLAFTRDTGHRHPHLVAALSNYWGLLSAGEWTETEMQERLRSLGPEAGLEESTWAALLGELGDTD
jgi:hypothetical protein